MNLDGTESVIQLIHWADRFKYVCPLSNVHILLGWFVAPRCYSLFTLLMRIMILFMICIGAVSGAETFFGQRGVKMVRSYQRLEGKAPRFLEFTFLDIGHTTKLS